MIIRHTVKFTVTWLFSLLTVLLFYWHGKQSWSERWTCRATVRWVRKRWVATARLRRQWRPPATSRRTAWRRRRGPSRGDTGRSRDTATCSPATTCSPAASPSNYNTARYQTPPPVRCCPSLDQLACSPAASPPTCNAKKPPPGFTAAKYLRKFIIRLVN